MPDRLDDFARDDVYGQHQERSTGEPCTGLLVVEDTIRLGLHMTVCDTCGETLAVSEPGAVSRRAGSFHDRDDDNRGF